jgi:hypothetical protein
LNAILTFQLKYIANNDAYYVITIRELGVLYMHHDFKSNLVLLRHSSQPASNNNNKARGMAAAPRGMNVQQAPAGTAG